ncbi:MAG: hypothetical protein Kow0079_13960 [Vicingaceae bacterium]
MIKIISYKILIILMIVPNLGTAQSYLNSKRTSLYYLHALCDTTNNSKIIPYINHWIKFLYTEDSFERKKMWNPQDINKWGDLEYALFYQSLFQYPQKSLLNYFKPYILSVYFEDTTCHIVTAFWNFNKPPSDSLIYQNSNPFAITEVAIYNQNNTLYLTNLFNKRTSFWKKESFNNIHYIYEPSLNLNTVDAMRSYEFIGRLNSFFGLNSDTITYVVCKTPQSLGYLLGFNFFYAGFTTGRTFPEAKILCSGNSLFYYPHELTHVTLDAHFKWGHFLSEAFATYFGGSGKDNFDQLLIEFKRKYPFITETTFNDIFNFPNSTDAYVLSAIMIDILLSKYGKQFLDKICLEKTENVEDFLNQTSSYLNYNKIKFINEINKIK